ncbi:helix-turn-helix transcriptional regulator [Bacteroides caecimuris]|jgi:predicted DNA-binding transcriptional regulator YafY|uniref:WYL domain-containing protein n=2 Tax=Bacteroides caecimuris TaxID=1796613 RepID=A0A1C7H0T2_9BACE|nr:WYL domain-containing protein [Bacteroides caecimuris]ANU57606.1 WYL domain-containing protein [Bacteroides caecimuris]OXE60937.1 WYL domain-containing protein [Bacteroides caecimuris]QQR17517.1 WYL domain-containing protein [Bacteroides caecimuris]UQA30508.1 WYL domain-containing protein [Bacteroides caecimuris]
MGKKLEGIQRMLVIINKLKERQRYVPREELEEYVRLRMEERDATPVDIRTIQRDFKNIEDLFGICIRFDKKWSGYYINEEDSLINEQYERLLLNFDLLNALDKTSNLHTYVLAEHHRPSDTECLPALIKAIKFSHPVAFDYIYVREEGRMRKKKVLPHYLKEDQQRWYLLAYDNNMLKTFNVDCIRNLRIYYEETFKRDMDIDANDLFKDSYGIWNQPDIPIEDIELSYSALDGRFLKSVPLHHSQKIIADNETEFRITLRLRITNDFVMALLARSSSLTVIKPLHLRERIRKVYEEALQRNT